MNKWYEQGGPDSDAVVSNGICLSRNLREYPFPVRMKRLDCAAVTKLVLNAAANAGDRVLSQLRFLDLAQMSDEENVSLVERQMASPELIFEPEGRGLLFSEDESVSILLNAENHVQLRVNAAGLNLEGAYRSADELDSFLDKTLHFAFDESLGYLTQNPANLGTGLCASLVLHLPALKESGSTAHLSASLLRLGITLRAFGGAGAEPGGAFFQLSNRMSLGLSEQEAISNLRTLAMQIIVQERAAREELAEKIEIQDMVLRSLGILKSARILPDDEFMQLISNVRFGVFAGILPDLDYKLLDKLAVELQPATLMAFSGKTLKTAERNAARSRMVQEVLNH